MKPYHGTLLACAVFLAALPLSGCGNPNDYSKTTDITLSASTTTIIVKREAVFTVQSPNPAIGEGYACDTTLEYRAEGAGMERIWVPVPGTETTRIFVLQPRQEGTLSVMARGKCTGANEDWKYSNQVDVTVTAVVVPTVVQPTVTAVTLTAGPTTVFPGNPVTFTLGATKTSDCTLSLKYQYSGAGFGVTTVNPAATGLFSLTPPSTGTLVVTATGWCTQTPTAEVSTTVNVVVPAATTITAPGAPTHSAPVTRSITEVFTSVGAACSNGEPVQYEFSATNSPSEGTPTAWGLANTVNFTWVATSSLPAVTVSVRARCQTSTTVISPTVISTSFTVL